MRERPILFSGEMVRAILNGRKTQTRRVIVPSQSTPRVAPRKMEPWMIDGEQEVDDQGRKLWVGRHPDYPTGEKWFSCAYGQPGDRLWVRETWCLWDATTDQDDGDLHTGKLPTMTTENVDFWRRRVQYRADHPSVVDLTWRPSIFMPRWASRITLEITGIRVERVQDITEADAAAEGITDRPNDRWRPLGSREPSRPVTRVHTYSALWDNLNLGRGYGWATDPWVWVIEFTQVQP